MTKVAKAGWIGAGMLVTGAGLTIIGAALITPVCFSWSTERVKKLATLGTERVIGGVESASTALGTTAGRVQKQFTRAAKLASEAREKASRHVGDFLPN